MEQKKIASKDVQIIRQSSLKIAQSILCCKVGNEYNINELIKLSELLTDYVISDYETVRTRAINFDNYMSKKIKK
jgi:hypothetical protein